MDKKLIAKYDMAAPRYTSYPTVPYWGEKKPSEEAWRRSVEDAWETGGRNMSLYIHLPFCESLCTYCACNTRITKNHQVEAPYIQRLLKEWAMYLDIIGETPRISELHLGGGTPTFFTPENLSHLIEGIRATAIIPKDAAFSFEAHPANTTAAHLQALFDEGFKRLSLGVQDFNPHVQQLINRHQTETQVKSVTDLARIIGYTSVNFDLIYGLPDQTLDSISDTIDKVVRMRPDRIAFYSYAHVPWMRPGQRAYTEADIPQGENKRALYERGRELLEAAGYTEIGLDHFALPGDELLTASLTNQLHRNFMGYTEHDNSLLIGLGVSAISDSGTMLVQNEKSLEDWNKTIDENIFPFFRGHQLDSEDIVLRKHILNIMCKGETSWAGLGEQCEELDNAIDRLQVLKEDKLVELGPFSLRVTKKGRPFLRNIGMCFDARYHRSRPKENLFSRST